MAGNKCLCVPVSVCGASVFLATFTYMVRLYLQGEFKRYLWSLGYDEGVVIRHITVDKHANLVKSQI